MFVHCLCRTSAEDHWRVETQLRQTLEADLRCGQYVDEADDGMRSVAMEGSKDLVWKNFVAYGAKTIVTPHEQTLVPDSSP